MSQVPKFWLQTQAMSFLQIWARVLAMAPRGSGSDGLLAETFMCIAFEETRFCNRLQTGYSPTATQYDKGGWKSLSAAQKNNLPNIGVGFTQVQIKQEDKKQIISEMGLDPESLRFRDVLASHDLSIQLGLRYLYAKGIKGQVGGHAQASAFRSQWPKSAKALQQALDARDLEKVIGALNSAILNGAHRVPRKQSFSTYWDFTFPAGEVELLFSM